MKRGLKVNRLLRKHFKTQEEFESKIGEIADGKVIEIEKLKKLVSETCHEELSQQKIGRRDVEGFLSCFIYNDYGQTQLSAIAPHIYEEPNDVITDVRPLPPPKEVNSGLSEVTSEKEDKKQLFRITKKLVEKVFQDPKSHFTTFRAWDQDGDGYVSYQDFVTKMEKLEIGATSGQALALAKFFDPDQNGYIEFKDFSRNLTPNLPYLLGQKSLQNENREYGGTIIPNSVTIAENDKRCKQAAQTYRKIDAELKPDPNAKLRGKTRFGATPQHKDNFVNFSAPKSAGFLSEEARFRKTHSVGIKCEFQKDDKAKKQFIEAGRLKRRADRMIKIEEQAAANDQRRDIFDAQKTLRKAGVLERYERVCHQS